MDARSRLFLLMSQMHLEPAEDIDCLRLSRKKEDSIYIGTATQPNGTKIKLLKTLLTSVCERNCNYCPFRANRDFPRATFAPDEFARIFMSLHNSRIANGIFLSSGVINGGVSTQDKIIATAQILRKKYKFRGYIHLKIMPGAEISQIEEAMLLANRVSVNLEAPNQDRLSRLAPHKNYLEELLQPLQWIEEVRKNKPGYRAWNGYWPSSVTQFVVGAVDDTDLELLSTTQFLYHMLNLKRAYYSAFSPIIDTPFEKTPPTSPIREKRLYEASFLIRDYGYDVEDLEFDISGNLPLHADPKLLWAQKNLVEPIEINKAESSQLLRIPGIGKKSVEIILASRRISLIRDLGELHHMGININRAAPYVLCNGKYPSRQLAFKI